MWHKSWRQVITNNGSLFSSWWFNSWTHLPRDRGWTFQKCLKPPPTSSYFEDMGRYSGFPQRIQWILDLLFEAWKFHKIRSTQVILPPMTGILIMGKKPTVRNWVDEFMSWENNGRTGLRPHKNQHVFRRALGWQEISISSTIRLKSVPWQKRCKQSRREETAVLGSKSEGENH